tara:strand:- start:80 stop:808 length:729 start_codon:yes stop_codon:yes gene_type:complete
LDLIKGLKKSEKYSKTSIDVKNAKLSNEFFTTINDCYKVNGYKYKPGHWRKDIFEVITSDGVYITETDLKKFKNKKIKVSSNQNPEPITWLWLNYLSTDVKDETSNDNFFEIKDALSLKIPKTTCYVYKIEIGNENYVGFTTKKPEDRVKEHLLNSETGAMNKINKAFRKWGYFYEFDVLGKYDNEIKGLIHEIKFIEKFKCTLNENVGGTGNNFNLGLMENNFGEQVFYVHDKHHILSKQA